MENNSPALEILERPAEIRLCIAALHNQREELFQRATRTTTYHGPRVSGSSGYSRHDSCLVVLADIDAEVSLYKNELSAAERDAEHLVSLVEQMPGWKAMRSALLLRLMFMQKLPWNEICVSLRDSGWNAPSSAGTRNAWLKSALRLADEALQAEKRAEIRHDNRVSGA